MVSTAIKKSRLFQKQFDHELVKEKENRALLQTIYLNKEV